MSTDAADALARRLAEVHLDLADATDDVQLLAACLRALEPYAPAIVDLHHLRTDERGEPVTSEPVAAWSLGGAAVPHPMLGRSVRLADIPLSDAWISDPDHALVIADVHDDPRSDPGLRAALEGRRSVAVLPLRSSHPTRWQGIVTLHWPAPHTPGPDERLVYRLLMHSLAACIAERRTVQAHADALAEVRALHRLSARIAEAADPSELLAAVIEEARYPGAQGKLIGLETDADGVPTVATVLAVAGGGPELAATIGNTVDVATSATTPLWLESPNAALLLGDLRSDPRPSVVEGRLRSGLGAAVLMPLRWHDRWIGLLQVGWPEPRVFDDSDRRFHEGLAPHVAAVLGNRQLVERCQRALAEQREQARTLQLVLDHLPVGVQIHDLNSGRRLINRTGLEVLNDPAPGQTGLPLYHPDSDTPVSPEERLSRIAISTGELVNRERDLEGPDGVRRRLSVTAAPVRDAHGVVTGAVTLFQDITARITEERTQARLRDAVIAAQRAALSERATPLIPIDDEILVMPLVGAIDRERGRQIVDTLVQLGGRERVRVVLIDLTGVRSLDEHGASALLEATRALRLRGADTFYTGIGPDVAWSLIEQGGERGGDLRLRTHATLQAGLAAALTNR